MYVAIKVICGQNTGSAPGILVGTYRQSIRISLEAGLQNTDVSLLN